MPIVCGATIIRTLKAPANVHDEHHIRRSNCKVNKFELRRQRERQYLPLILLIFRVSADELHPFPKRSKVAVD